MSPKTAKALDDAPEVSFEMMPVGRATFAAISNELRDESPQIEVHPAFEPDSSEEINVFALEIERQHSFVVQVHRSYLSSPRARKRLLELRLLPALGLRREEVTRLTVEPQDSDSCRVTVWTRLDSGELG